MVERTFWYCNTCDQELTAEEYKLNEDRCEECERVWQDRVKRWRAEAKDKQLDEFYSKIWKH
jgi:uncharacterized CHY-type Zn-finger protein